MDSNTTETYEAPRIRIIGGVLDLTASKKASQVDFEGAGEDDGGYFPSGIDLP